MRLFSSEMRTKSINKIIYRELRKGDMRAQEETLKAARRYCQEARRTSKRVASGGPQEMTAFPEWTTFQKAAEWEA